MYSYTFSDALHVRLYPDGTLELSEEYKAASGRSTVVICHSDMNDTGVIVRKNTIEPIIKNLQNQGAPLFFKHILQELMQQPEKPGESFEAVGRYVLGSIVSSVAQTA